MHTVFDSGEFLGWRREYAPMSVRVERVSFGSIVIDGREYKHDVVICSGKVLRRLKKLSKKYRGEYGHTPLSLEEVAETLNMCPGVETVVIGKGIYGDLPVPEETVKYLENQGLKVIIVNTPEIPSVLAREAKKGRVLAIVHVTC